MPIVMAEDQQTYVAGTTIRFTATFKDLSNDQLADPTTVACAYALEGGTPTNTIFGAGPIVKDTVGVYHLDITTTGMVEVGDSNLLRVIWGGQGNIDVIEPPITVGIDGPAFAIAFS